MTTEPRWRATIKPSRCIMRKHISGKLLPSNSISNSSSLLLDVVLV